MSSDPAIQFRHVTKEYHVENAVLGGLKNLVLHLPTQIRAMRARKPFCALQDLSLEIAQGESLSVIGRNGAGKSTLLGLIAGVLRPSAGTVVTRGRICPLLELGAGFHADLTGRENIVLNGILLGLTRREVLARLDEIIDFSGLAQFVDRPLRTYSSGMTARLGFSVAVHLSPNILLVDEALAVGDLEFQQKCLARMQQFRSDAVTMVFVSHDMESVARVSDRVAWMDGGRLREIGPPQQVIEHYHAFVHPTVAAA
ncbi:MAG: ABC transporter ATP-binding protein [Planctomycetaceae bacterium]|nr:ABC transporter ATP-binding protein [Planctomycetaceae bacterium]